MNRYVCRNCGFEAELGSRQPYYVMSGSITEKYCPQTGEIVEIFREYDAGPPEISCQKEKRLDAPCQNCRGSVCRIWRSLLLTVKLLKPTSAPAAAMSCSAIT